jgi:hypothetical protein
VPPCGPVVVDDVVRVFDVGQVASGRGGVLGLEAYGHEPPSASGVAPDILADLLGHKDTRMVHHYYRHRVTPTISVARDRMEDAL